jgi:type IV pilus assembly protein PilM
MSVGLDIGSRTLKVIELTKEKGANILKSAGLIGYSGINIDESLNQKAVSEIASVIKKLFHDTKISAKSVTISLPETKVFSRLLKFPLLNDQEIASAVKWEAEEYIPIPVNDAVIEHTILERQENVNPPQVLVFLVATLKALVDKYVEIINLAGFEVEGVETELMSIVRSTALPGKSIVVVDFGAQSTGIAVAKNEELYFSRSIPTAGDAFTRAVAQSMGVSLEQAEEYKKTYGLAPSKLEGKVGFALGPIMNVVIEEIKKAIHYYQLEIKGTEPTKIVLAGGSAGIPGIVPEFAKKTGIEVEVANPFSKISVDPKSVKTLANYAPLYAVAAGLALRGE